MFNQRFQGVVSAASKVPSEGQPLGDQSTTPGADTLRWDSSSVGLAQISTLDSGRETPVLGLDGLVRPPWSSQVHLLFPI